MSTPRHYIVDYVVEYTYYRWNSRLADNGECTKRRVFHNEAAATHFARSINEKIGPEFVREKFVNSVLFEEGYFTKPAKLFVITEEELKLS